MPRVALKNPPNRIWVDFQINSMRTDKGESWHTEYVLADQLKVLQSQLAERDKEVEYCKQILRKCKSFITSAIRYRNGGKWPKKLFMGDEELLARVDKALKQTDGGK